MAISNVTKYLKFASAQMAAESLFSGESANPAEIDVGKKIIDPRSLNVASLRYGNTRASKFTSNTKGQSQIVLRGAHMNEKSDSMEKKSTPTPGAHEVDSQPWRYLRIRRGGSSWRADRKPNTPIGGRLRAKVAGSDRGMASFNIGAHKTKPAYLEHNKSAGQPC